MRSVLEDPMSIMFVYQKDNGMNKPHSTDVKKKDESSKKDQDVPFSELLSTSMKSFK